MHSSYLTQVKDYLMALQDSICQQLEEADGAEKFQEDSWDRPGGGGGRSRILKTALFLSKAASVSRMFMVKKCPPLQLRIGRSLKVVTLMPAAYRWCCTLKTHSYPLFI